MKKVICLQSISRIFSLLFLSMYLSFSAVMAQEAAADDVQKGKQLFNQNCAACHALNRKMTGPALAGVVGKYDGDKEWLYAWIKNSQSLIKSGDARALSIYNEFNQTQMTAFPLLSNSDIDAILAYTDAPEPAPAAPAAMASAETAAPATSGVSNELILGALVVVFGLLLMMLVFVRRILTKIAVANGIYTEEKKTEIPSFWKYFSNNPFLIFVTVLFLLLFSAYQVYGYLTQIGVDQGYAPIQPIHFSHKIHAGDNKIECTYCHSSARSSKHSGVPSLNICMNCHKSIYEYKGNPEGPTPEDLAEGYTNEFYTGEIKKLYQAVGWDENTQSYTGNAKPVEWVRIHKLPDFAYFNHAQHVTVAGVACQTCHGPVEEMEIAYQYSPLTMGWCIDCHRATEVDVKSNEYYASIHKALSEKYGVEKLTAAQMGGLECGKCHY